MNFSMKTRSSPNERLGLRVATRETLGDLLRRVRDAHALAAAAGRRLDHDREADGGGDALRVGDAVHAADVPGHGGNAGSAASFFDASLSPIASMACGFGPMKVMPASASARAKAAFSDRKP